MPIVTITVRRPKTTAFKNNVLEAVYASLVEVGGAHPQDRFHRVHELPAEDFRFDPTFPDLNAPRTDDFILVEVLLGTGRSIKLKRQILKDMLERLSRQGLNPEHVMVYFQDVPWESISTGGGRIPHG
jgi:phenylpyruvate tautomerase PptA (4-oxalocrotonate tautomerase family)